MTLKEIENLVIPTEESTNLFHLSYDKISDSKLDNKSIKERIVWEILLEQSANYYLDSPTETTIVFKSKQNYIWWYKKLELCFGKDIVFQISLITFGTFTIKNENPNKRFYCNKYPSPKNSTSFRQNCVIPLQDRMNNEVNPASIYP